MPHFPFLRVQINGTFSYTGHYKDIPDPLNNMNDTIKQAIDLQEAWLTYDQVMGKVRFTALKVTSQFVLS